MHLLKFCITLVFAISLFSTGTADSRRRYRRPPGGWYYGQNNGFGQQQELGNGWQQSPDFGNYGQREFPSFPGQGQMEYGGLQKPSSPAEDDYEGTIQQMSTDDDDVGFIKTPSRRSTTPVPSNPPAENEIVDKSPPKYTHTTESSLDVTTQSYSRPEAVTPAGTFIGKKETINGKDVYAFYGIRYAKPPTGELRFKRPEPTDKLTEPFEATNLPASCPQTAPTVFPDFPGEQMWIPNTNFSEDCLFLNIWVPASVFEEKEEKQVPVFYWIYGGGFFSGSNSLDVYNGATLAATEDVIVVNVQYRLGPLGFLFFGTKEAPGNQGLLDQTLGLKWIRENIEYFGGDPNLITLAGESAGAASVGFHLVSPISKNYFKRAMMTSGLPTMIYALKSPEELKSRSYLLAKHAGCNQKNCNDIVECLRKVDSEKLAALQWKLFKGILDFPFAPTIDGYFLTDHPDALIKRGKAKRTELILGTVEDEGTYFILYHYLNYMSHLKSTSIPYDRFVEIMEELFGMLSENEREAIINRYTNWENPEDGYQNQKLIGEAIGDAWFTCPHRKFADDWSNRGLPVYYFHYTERSKLNPWAEWMGVMHGDDVPLVFGAAVSNSSYPASEKQMTLNFLDMVGSFMKTGTPSRTWERYTSEYSVYLDVNATVISQSTTPDKHGPRASQCAFWNKMIPIIQNAEVQCQTRNSQPNFQSQPQYAPKSQTQERPQWNNNGHGIHGGQGFLISKFNMQGPPYPQRDTSPFGFQPACGTSINNQYTQQRPNQGFGQGQQGYESQLHTCEVNDGSSPSHSSPKQPTSSESCKCTITEKQSNSEVSGTGQDSNLDAVTPTPVY